MKKPRLGLAAVVAMLAVCVLTYLFTRPHFAALNATESLMVGSWAFVSLDHKGKTIIVYHFAADRRIREEHYYLTSASPNVPRISMVGKWRVDTHGRLTVEPNSGFPYVRDSMSGWLNEYFDDGRQAWTQPILTRFYKVQSATSSGIQVDCNLSGGGPTSFTLLPFAGDPTIVPSQ
jgi:hypothetical protein